MEGNAPQPKQQETEAPKPVERWLNVGESLKKEMNQNLINQGLSMFESSTDCLMTADQGGIRTNQVLEAFKSSAARMSGENLRATGNGNVTIGIMIFTTKRENVGIVINRLKNMDDDEYAKQRSRILESTNEILSVFEKPQLPQFTSQNRKTIN